jgi:predicted pyridoxine 5'-phosphate oxidase superfamily flavin-nucleotide-binding protein
MFTEELRSVAERAVLCWLATVDGEGRPNVSPKELFRIAGEDRLEIAEIASPTSARNLRGNPHVCVSFVDVFVQKGFKVQGHARLLQPEDSAFEAAAKPLRELAGDAFRIRGVICVTAESVAPIVAPSYRFVPGTTEAGQVAAAMRRYGVRPAAPVEARE